MTPLESPSPAAQVAGEVFRAALRAASPAAAVIRSWWCCGRRTDPPGVTCGTVPPTTTRDVLAAAVASHPDRDAYVLGERRTTYADLDRCSAGAATTLRDAGVTQGDVVALLLPSGPDYAIWYLAALRLGAIASGINRRLGPAERASILRRTEPRATIAPDGEDLPVDVAPGAIVTASAFAEIGRAHV